MHRLRAHLSSSWASEEEWAASLIGWQPDSTLDVCSWGGVTCNAEGRVRALNLTQPPQQTAPGIVWHSLLFPELAQLRSLELCLLVCYTHFPWPPLPDAWLAPGAFPSLQELFLAGRTLSVPLPAIPPGALPRLERLSLHFDHMHTPLPSGWGSDPAVLPRLRHLELEVSQVQHGLPAAWSTGFRELEVLSIKTRSNHQEVSSNRRLAGVAAPPPVYRAPGTAAATVRHTLPASWASGFPKLQALTLNWLALIGTLPSSWQTGGFPQLLSLELPSNQLTGTLPPQLLAVHPQMTTVNLAGNRFSGPLPDAWASSAMLETLVLGDGNKLSGPAFPPAWLQPNALPRLSELDLSNNAQLSGNLPANLSWPNLHSLSVGGTNVTGGVPVAWCHAPFAPDMRLLLLRTFEEEEPPLPSCAATSFQNLQAPDRKSVV